MENHASNAMTAWKALLRQFFSAPSLSGESGAGVAGQSNDD
jgi:hypothetical protein